MHIGYSTNQGYLDFLSAVATSSKAATTEPKGEDFAGSVEPVGTILSAANIASRYDFANISPQEIDRLASELHAGGHISDRENLVLLTHGADFLSHLPGNNYGEEKLAERSDLLGQIKEKLTLAQYRGEPTADRVKLQALLEKLQALASLKKKNSGAPQNARISNRTLTELIAQQERYGGFPVDQLKPIDISKLEIISLPPGILERINQGQSRIYIEPNIRREEIYAKVVVGGKVIAKIANGGGVESSNAMAARIQDIFKNEAVQGPLLAEQRAQKIAVAFGGTVERLSTAQTQQQWENRLLTTWSIDADRLAHHGFDMPVDLIGKQFASAEFASEAVLSIIK